MPQSTIALYQSADGQIQLNVSLDEDTVWLTQRQMATLFGTSADNVSLHLKNVYAEAELTEAATTEDFSVVQDEGARQVRRRLKHYNLDAIISIGYRVSSTRATQFRQWATTTLKQHLIQGYTLNQQRLQERGVELKHAVDLLSRTLTSQRLLTGEGRAVLGVIQDYARSWSLLQGYDEQSLGEQTNQQEGIRALALNDVLEAIAQLQAELIAKG